MSADRKNAIIRKPHGFGPDNLERRRLALQAVTRRKLFQLVISRKRMWDRAPDAVSAHLHRIIIHKEGKMVAEIESLANSAIDLGCTEERVQRILDGNKDFA